MSTYVGKLLNCGEVENIIREEKEKRRKTRLNQVRHYSRENSQRILSNVRNERKRQLELIRNRLKDDWKKSKEKQLEELSAEYGRCLRNVGNGHRSALNEIAQEDALKKKSSDNLERALSRGNDALARLSLERSQLHEKLVQKNSSIHVARQVEKERAKRIASLPPPTCKDQSNEIVTDEGVIETNGDDIEVVDAREAARLEEERISSEKVKNRTEEVERSIVRASRYSDARSHFEMQKEYNRIMDELEKISVWEKSNDRKTIQVSIQNKEELIAKQEAIVEELFNRLSIPLVSVDSSTFPNSSSETNEDETPVHHILVSSSTLDEVDAIVPSISSTRHREDPIVVPPVRSESRFEDEAPSLSSSSASPLNQRLPESFSIRSNETILASHPNDFLSSVTIDLSTLPITEESSTKLPLSTKRSSFETDSEENSTLRLDESSNSVENTLEMKDRTAALSSNDSSDSFSTESEPKLSKDGPIFLNVAVRRHNLTHDAINLKETIIKPKQVDKNIYLRSLLSLAVQRRETEKDNDLNLADNHDSVDSSFAIGDSRLAELKASFVQAQHTLQTELDALRFERERILSKGTTKTAESFEKMIQLPLQSMIPHELSTILEVDTPDSPQQLFQSRNEDNFILTERGITDEPNLTLVGSDSTSCNVSEHSFTFDQSFKLFSNVSTEVSQTFKTPSTIGSSGSWFNSTAPRKQKLKDPQNSNNEDQFITFQDTFSRSNLNSFGPTPSISGSSNEFFNSCFSKKPNKKTSSRSSTPLPKPQQDNPFISPALTSLSLAKFFDTPQQRSELKGLKYNETSLSYLDSIASSLTTKSSDTDTIQGDSCPMCPSTNTDTNGSSAAFNESLSESLVSFLKHEHSANVSTVESFSTGLETSSEN